MSKNEQKHLIRVHEMTIHDDGSETFSEATLAVDSEMLAIIERLNDEPEEGKSLHEE